MDSFYALESQRGSSELRFSLADAMNLPLKSAALEFVFASEILEHLVDPEKGLDEWRRVLKKNGNIIITTPNTSMSWRGLFLKFFKDKEQDFVGHISEYDVRDLCKSLEGRSFEV